jgi:carbon-monoxide dehydrogenase medium subunit
LPERGRLLATPALITELVIPRWGDSTGAALEIVSRTPADAPIVAVAAMLAFAGDRVAHARLALAGVAGTVVRLPEIEAMLADQALTPDLIASAAARVPELLHPAGDFRGSAEYRRAMAGVLTQRALKAIVTR